MGAPLGNQYWKIRLKDGQDKKYTPTELLKGCNEYFQWCIDNPLYEKEIVKGSFVEILNGEKINVPYGLVDVPKMRPYTIEGLCNYLDIVVNTFKNYEKDKEYLMVTTRARQIIYNQKFEGAASGFLNPNIIARDLGLSNKSEIDHTTKGESLNQYTTEELKARAKAARAIEDKED